MDRQKAVGALTAAARMGGLMFVVLLADHWIGKPTLPPWGFWEFLRCLFWSIVMWIVMAVISYVFQVTQERLDKSKL
jgi:hypothetical protein